MKIIHLFYTYASSHTFAPRDSNLIIKESASGTRPPDEAYGSGDETIMPQRSSEAERSSAPNSKFSQISSNVFAFFQF